jgi:hypothetical protein
MKIEGNKDGEIILREVFNGVGFISPDDEEFNICMRDGGYEFSYQGAWFRAVGGKIEPMSISTKDGQDKEDGYCPIELQDGGL